MAFETQDPGDEAQRDDAATERVADEPPESPSEHHDDSDEPGGPYGNPGVDEESLRKQQEESSERGNDSLE
jgi:hypothetical protein